MNYGGFSKSTVFQCARSLLLLLFSCRTRGLCNSRKPQSTFSDGSTQLNISSPHIGFYQSGLTVILSLGNVHNSYVYRVIDTLPVFKLCAGSLAGTWKNLDRQHRVPVTWKTLCWPLGKICKNENSRVYSRIKSRLGTLAEALA